MNKRWKALAVCAVVFVGLTTPVGMSILFMMFHGAVAGCLVTYFLMDA